MFVRLLPRDEDMMRLLKHPSGARFTSMERPAEWPLDQFTMRRLKSGAVTQVGQPYPGNSTRADIAANRRAVKGPH